MATFQSNIWSHLVRSHLLAEQVIIILMKPPLPEYVFFLSFPGFFSLLTEKQRPKLAHDEVQTGDLWFEKGSFCHLCHIDRPTVSEGAISSFSDKEVYAIFAANQLVKRFVNPVKISFYFQFSVHFQNLMRSCLTNRRINHITPPQKK